MEVLVVDGDLVDGVVLLDDDHLEPEVEEGGGDVVVVDDEVL